MNVQNPTVIDVQSAKVIEQLLQRDAASNRYIDEFKSRWFSRRRKLPSNGCQTRLGSIAFRFSSLRQMRRGRALLGEEERLDGIGGLRGREKMIGDVVRPDGEGGMSVVDGFEASYSRKGAFSCCNFFYLSTSSSQVCLQLLGPFAIAVHGEDFQIKQKSTARDTPNFCSFWYNQTLLLNNMKNAQFGYCYASYTFVFFLLISRVCISEAIPSITTSIQWMESDQQHQNQ